MEVRDKRDKHGDVLLHRLTQIMGHDSRAITMVYMKDVPGELQRTVEESLGVSTNNHHPEVSRQVHRR